MTSGWDALYNVQSSVPITVITPSQPEPPRYFPWPAESVLICRERYWVPHWTSSHSSMSPMSDSGFHIAYP